MFKLLWLPWAHQAPVLNHSVFTGFAPWNHQKSTKFIKKRRFFRDLFLEGLGSSWEVPRGTFRGLLGEPWESFGRPWGALGGALGSSWVTFWCVLGTSWLTLGSLRVPFVSHKLSIGRFFAVVVSFCLFWVCCGASLVWGLGVLGSGRPRFFLWNPFKKNKI